MRYTEVTSSRATSTDFNVNGGSATSASIDGLQRYTRYSFEVAAIGAGKMGVFSGPVTANTSKQLYRRIICRIVISMP